MIECWQHELIAAVAKARLKRPLVIDHYTADTKKRMVVDHLPSVEVDDFRKRKVFEGIVCKHGVFAE